MKQSASTQRYWRSLEDLAKTPEYQELVSKEFPAGPEEEWTSSSRRRFLQLMGASIALGTAASCQFEPEHIVPVKSRDEDRVPGKPKHYAGAMELGGWSQPLLVTCYDGRPTKVDGNPEHAESPQRLRGKGDMSTTATALGKVKQVIGPTVDVEFPSDALPDILNAITIKFFIEMFS